MNEWRNPDVSQRVLISARAPYALMLFVAIVLSSASYYHFHSDLQTISGFLFLVAALFLITLSGHTVYIDLESRKFTVSTVSLFSLRCGKVHFDEVRCASLVFGSTGFGALGVVYLHLKDRTSVRLSTSDLVRDEGEKRWLVYNINSALQNE